MPRRQRRAHGRGEDGITLVELMVASALLGGVLAIVFGVLVSFQNALTRSTARNNAVDQAHLAVQQIDNQVRSANSFYVPSSSTMSGTTISSGYSLVIYGQTNGNYRCQQWSVGNHTVQTRSWNVTYPDDGSSVGTWRVVATDIDTSQGTTPFVVDSATYSGRLLNVDLYVIPNSNQGSGSEPTFSQGNDAEVQDSVAGRDIEYTNAGTTCQTVPS